MRPWKDFQYKAFPKPLAGCTLRQRIGRKLPRDLGKCSGSCPFHLSSGQSLTWKPLRKPLCE